MDTVDTHTEYQKSTTELLLKILNKIEKIETSLLSVNTDLISQNIRLSEAAIGKLPEPETNDPSPSPSTGSNNASAGTKDLFYCERNNKVYVYGPGTFDNKQKLKENGANWNGSNKSWELVIEIEQLNELFTNIKEKEL